MRRGGGSEGRSGLASPVREIDRSVDLEGLLSQDAVMIFKHSPSCPVSWSAHLQVTKFLDANPEIPVYMVSVIRERALSDRIAARLGVQHESPQVIFVRRGEVVSAASHAAVTEKRLTWMLSAEAHESGHPSER